MISRMHHQYDFCDILLTPRVQPSTMQNLDSRSKIPLGYGPHHMVPLIAANMDGLGNFDFARFVAPYQIGVAILKDFTVQDWELALSQNNLFVPGLIPTLGLRRFEQELERVRDIVHLAPKVPMICLDVANGYMQVVAKAVRQLKDAFPHHKICAGNVVDSKGVRHLAEAGADVVKVGIGSGSVCLTRRMTGIGHPQFSAVLRVAEVADELGVEIISDGGVRESSDMVKALAAGAHYVMAGGLFAGHDETGTRFHGMSSDRARTERGEGVADYRASEGREVELHPRGSLHETLRHFMGGLRSACTYLGVERLSDIRTADIEASIVQRQMNRIQGVKVERSPGGE